MFASLRRTYSRWMPVVVLWVIFGLLMYNAWAQSPTMDEQNHIARGYALLRTGDPRLSLEHPPFVNLLEALPLLLLRDAPQLPLDDWTWEQGYWYGFADVFLWQVNSQPDLMVFLARLPVIAMTLLLVALASRWARELWGRGAAIVALVLVGFDPNILANGTLVTTDLGLTFTAFLAGYAVWRMRGEVIYHGDTEGTESFLVFFRELWEFAVELRWSILAAGLAMGMMLGSKTSAPMFWGIFGALFVLDAFWDGAAGWPRRVPSGGVTRRCRGRVCRRGWC